MFRLLRSSLIAVSMALLLATTAMPVFAQAPSEAARERSAELWPKIVELSQQGDLAAARRMAAEASEAFAAGGEVWLAASYAVSAAAYDLRMGDVARIEAETAPRMDELLATLDPVDTTRGDLLVEVLMDAKGRLGQHEAQDEMAALYEQRARDAHGETSEEDLEARTRASLSLLEAGRMEAGYERLRAALLAAARTDHHALTIRQYTENARLFHANNMPEQAAQLFADGAQTDAARAQPGELADFYLAYAEFRTDFIDPEQHFVPLYTAATNLYEAHYGRGSRELIHANDKLGAALARYGQYGTAADIAQTNYDDALDTLGPDDTITWRLANNLADVLRGLGSPSRALEYDLIVLENRTRHYGQNHFNTLVSANNTGQSYLDLARYDDARRLFELCREIAEATGDSGNLPVMEAWIDYTDLVSGAREMDDAAVARMDALVTDGDYPAILSLKAANLLADHFAQTGDRERRMMHLEQAYGIAGRQMSPMHPLTFAARIAIANAKAETDIAAAAADFDAVDREMLYWVQFQTAAMSSRDVVETTRAMADDFLHDYARLAESNASLVPAFADAARRWPLLTTQDHDIILKIERRLDPSDAETAGVIRRMTRQARVAREMFAAGVEQDMAYEILGEVKALERELTDRLVDRYEFDRETLLAQSLPGASELLRPDEVMVQYFITRKWSADREGADPLEDTILYAIVWRGGEEPTLHNLGDPGRIEQGDAAVQMASLRTARSAAGRGAISLAAGSSAFSGLYDRLIAPFEAEMEGAETVLVIPDGQLFAVPFSLLEDTDGRFLEERFMIRLLTRPEALFGIGREQRLAEGGRAVLAGGIDYTNGDEEGAEPLPGTLDEVEAISGILGERSFAMDVLTGADVTEAALRERMEGAAIAHLATHGAYRSATTGGAGDIDTLWQSEVILARSGDRHTMMRDEDDGRLYAFELMGWDLSGLDLLVLSACETGRGEETFVGGLRGLPTAADIAGARRSLLTLWPVDDAGTAEFMVRYYEHLTSGETYAQALRLTRRDAIDGKLPQARDPLVWAAFVLFEN